MSLPSSAATVTVYVSSTISVMPDFVRSWPLLVDVERGRVVAFEAVGQRVARIGVRRRDGSTYEGARRRACAYASRGARALGEHRRVVGPGVVRLTTSLTRPVARTLGVLRPHGDIVGRAGTQSLYRHRRTRDRRVGDLRPRSRHLSVLVVVVGDGRAGVVGLLPTHLQARARYRRNSRSQRCSRSFAVHVRHPDRHVGRVGTAPSVRHTYRHGVARLLLVVQLRACPYLTAVGGRQDVERVRVRSFQGVGQRVAVAVGRRDRGCRCRYSAACSRLR